MHELQVDWRRLKELRESLGLTQGQLAGKAKIGQSHISRLEGGREKNAKLRTINTLARALGVSPIDLLEGTRHNDMSSVEPRMYLVQRYRVKEPVAHALEDMIDAFIQVHRQHTETEAGLLRTREQSFISPSVLAYSR